MWSASVIVCVRCVTKLNAITLSAPDRNAGSGAAFVGHSEDRAYHDLQNKDAETLSTDPQWHGTIRWWLSNLKLLS